MGPKRCMGGNHTEPQDIQNLGKEPRGGAELKRRPMGQREGRGGGPSRRRMAESVVRMVSEGGIDGSFQFE